MMERSIGSHKLFPTGKDFLITQANREPHN